MSYIVRSGVVTASTALLGESGQRYAYLTIDSTDVDTTAAPIRFNVQVFAITAERIVRIVESGHSPRVVFAGRLVVSETPTPEGRTVQEWNVGAEHLGISVEDELLMHVAQEAAL
ncbi:hypothetical protein [Rathayibacter toxicus]|uniref:Single-stranded DNA-binding protein n=1 Tax=Rathayibacter toxicus TaxID=145458 RepID=A0A0C5BSF9_9MICO|nr:hypothetical protein [Rathayibacter toxicus]AJM77612.1 hypothetical protein TI83_06015 [Rathayibacter toxicus]ALS56454.1 hypothetical protein APU90_00465 [Rathayibacter toxicus]KKM44562.1 hypothetical protein VT73_08425 [Rathayibacter toxicus]PPG21728.1 hypothetical protein C5D15_05820 [Rathayibacter toxicus]PPG46690.1 hypothetical protein C5D16_05795 [Rathayibacter toxicus]